MLIFSVEIRLRKLAATRSPDSLQVLPNFWIIKPSMRVDLPTNATLQLTWTSREARERERRRTTRADPKKSSTCIRSAPRLPSSTTTLKLQARSRNSRLRVPCASLVSFLVINVPFYTEHGPKNVNLAGHNNLFN